MACFAPLDAWRLSDGAIFFGAERPNSRPVTLPCGQCVGCRLERSRQWAMRCMHEASLFDRSCFVTLTYNDLNCPVSLNYRDYQLFMKRLRKWHRANSATQDVSLWSGRSGDNRSYRAPRFFMSGEYGETLFRPHYHALLFGVAFPDSRPWRISPAGFEMFRSETLDRLWSDTNGPLGNAEIGEVTFESAAYVARYCVKKVTGDAAEEHYTRVDWRTGELIKVEPEFARMSLKPGIGADWIRLYRTDVYRGDGDAYVVVNGMKVKPPKFYDRYMEDTMEFEEVQCARVEKALIHRGDNTDDRLAVREKVTRARLSFKPRSIR